VYHRANTANPETDYLVLNSGAATADSDTRWNDTQPTDAVFSLGTDATVNASGGTYVAYLFAHDAGGFGLEGTDNVISCGSYTGTGAIGNATNLGFEAQWVLTKRVDDVSNWALWDNMRGIPATVGQSSLLLAQMSTAETVGSGLSASATGFVLNSSLVNFNASGGTYIYIAIRRGPMAVPTTGTSVLGLNTRTGTGASASISGFSFPPDLAWSKARTAGPPVLFDKLRGTTPMLQSSSTSAESTQTNEITSFGQSGVSFGASTFGYTNLDGEPYVNWLFRRAPGFFDEVCYTGDSVQNRAIQHNLTVTPELMILKRRTGGNGEWPVYHKDIPSASPVNVLFLNDTLSYAQYGGFYSNPTDTNFYVYNNDLGNLSGSTYVNYLFASAPGVSKVGGYTGTGATQVINCGFTAGARFVLIKRTDDTGDWYVWDSARGIVAGDDPYLLLNSTAAEVTNTDYVDTAATGFEITSTAPAAINASGGTFIFLAIA
jgi:hypothetical protein